MTRLTESARHALPPSAFVFPKTRTYPIHDADHARAALSDVSHSGNAAEKTAVRAAVARKYPGIDQSTGPSPDSAPNEMVDDSSEDPTAAPSEGLVGP